MCAEQMPFWEGRGLGQHEWKTLEKAWDLRTWKTVQGEKRVPGDTGNAGIGPIRRHVEGEQEKLRIAGMQVPRRQFRGQWICKGYGIFHLQSNTVSRAALQAPVRAIRSSSIGL